MTVWLGVKRIFIYKSSRSFSYSLHHHASLGSHEFRSTIRRLPRSFLQNTNFQRKLIRQISRKPNGDREVDFGKFPVRYRRKPMDDVEMQLVNNGGVIDKDEERPHRASGPGVPEPMLYIKIPKGLLVRSDKNTGSIMMNIAFKPQRGRS